MATAFKQIKNNAKSTLNGAIGTGDTTIAVQSGQGSRFPQPGNGFWATIWNQGFYQDPGDDPGMEIVLVTARSTDALTVTRGQLGTSATNHADMHTIRHLFVDQQLTDIHNAVNAFDTSVVHTTGNETVAGIKTFSSSPLVPTPTTTTQVASKGYVDSVAGSGSTPDADAVTKGKVQLAGELGGVGSVAAAPTIKNMFRVFNVKDYGAIGDGVADDLAEVQAAIDAANAAGGGDVFFPTGTYLLSNSIVPKSNVTLRGVKYSSILKMSLNNGRTIYLVTGNLTNFTLDSITFAGSVNEFPTTPKRTRTTSGNGAETAVYISGNGDPFQVGAGNVSNFTMKDCKVENHTALPIRIAGTTGIVRVVDCDFINNQDPGFIFNEEVIFNNNHSMMGADNGVSLSRGNRKVTCVGNTIENVAFQGIFIAGFDINGDGDVQNIGPTNFTVVGNTIKDCGYNAIYADAAPKHGVIAGNIIEQGYWRGPVGIAATDINSVGIYIAGYPFPYNQSTTVAAGSNGAVLPQATINVASTTGFPSAGSFSLNSETITYTGKTATTFTGCSGGTSTLATGNTVTLIPSAYAEDIDVVGNTIYQCGRAGIEVFASKDINIYGNKIQDCGTEFLADGSTPVGSTSVTSNVGILIRSAGTPDNIVVGSNTISDRRAVPLTNYGIVPFSSIPTTYEYSNNRMYNCRNAYNLIDYSINDHVFSGGASILQVKGLNDAHNNRVLTITDNASVTPNFLNVQGSVGGQAVAFAAESFTETDIPITFRSKGIASVIFRPGSNLVPAIQFRRADNVSANSVMNIDTTNARVGINTVTPASSLHVVGTIRGTDLLLTNPVPVTSGGTGQNSLTSLPLTTPRITNGLDDSAGNRMITFTATASAVTNLGVQNAATGGTLGVTVTSTDTNAGMTFRSKGNGTIGFRPETDTIIASQWRKADNASVILNVDTTNGRLGINTAAPTRTMDVVGITRLQSLVGSNSTVPTGVYGTGAGTSPSPSTPTITGSNIAGTIAVGTGTSCPGTATIATVTFASPATTIAAGSNGAVLPQAIINVASTAGFPSFGTFTVDGDTVTYTGLTSTTFTGCTGGTATLATNDAVAAPTFAFPNAPYVLLTPGNSAAAVRNSAGQVFVDSAVTTTTAFVMKVGSTALTDSTVYVWYYQVIG